MKILPTDWQCQRDQMASGHAYPRSCLRCRLGPCQKYGQFDYPAGFPEQAKKAPDIDGLRAEATEALRESTRLISGMLVGHTAARVIEDNNAALVALSADPPVSAWRPTHQHYKGGLYRVIGPGKIEADLSPVVIYESREGHRWVRPVVDFIGTVEVNGALTQRFTPILASEGPPVSTDRERLAFALLLEEHADRLDVDNEHPTHLVLDLRKAAAFIRQPVAAEGWRPIASAPKDGTEVDLWIETPGGGQGRRPDCHYHCDEWLYWGGDPEIGWLHVEDDDTGRAATHWRPRPCQPMEDKP